MVAFSGNQSGGTAVLFALVLCVLAGSVGMAVDHARLLRAEVKLRNALDTAVLAGARSYGQTRDEAIAISAAQSFFDQAMSTEPDLSSATFNNPEVSPDKKHFTAASYIEIQASITSLLGFSQFPVNVESTAALSIGNIEVAVMIDLSSSMTGARFTDTKSSLHDFVDIIMENDLGPNPARVAFAPFASAVNPGSFAAAVRDPIGPAAACVGERFGAQQYTDEPPGVGQYFNAFVPASGWPCLTTQIMPLETSKATVESRINALQLSEGTAGHLGTMWSWYLLSPKWNAIWPSANQPEPYGSTAKVAILMTDGENFPKDLPTDEAADDYALEVCNNMKAAGITIYSVGFHVTASRAYTLLRACASSPDKHYFPSGGSELTDAFREIASSFAALRLTQ